MIHYATPHADILISGLIFLSFSFLTMAQNVPASSQDVLPYRVCVHVCEGRRIVGGLQAG